MKKFIVIIVVISSMLLSSCGKPDNTPSNSAHGSEANSFKAATNTTNSNNSSNSITEKSQQANSTNNKNTDSDANKSKVYAEDNPFFFNKSVSQLTYKGSLQFNDIVEKQIKLNISEIANIKYGKLYELKIDSDKDIPNVRLNLGYFYVQKDKIYKIQPTEENLNKLKAGENIPSDSVIVCQDTELKDPLDKNQPGMHRYIAVNGDRREYHFYNDQVSTGYYESFIWEKNKGLINYRSGYAAGKDSIELQLTDN